MRKITAALTKPGGCSSPTRTAGRRRSSGLAVGWRRSGDLLAVSNDPKAGDP